MQSMYDEQDFKSEDELVDYFEEILAENLEGLVGNIADNYDFPSFYLSDDDSFQIEANLAGPSSVDLWKEDHVYQLQESNEPSQAIYDTDEESYESILAGEYSFNLHSDLYHIISNNFHENGIQQLFNAEDEEESNEETLEQDEYTEPSPERVEVINENPAQEYVNIFTELNTLVQKISELQDDNTAKYDESSSSDDDEDEGVFLSEKDLLFDPVEKEEILVENHLPITHN